MAANAPGCSAHCAGEHGEAAGRRRRSSCKPRAPTPPHFGKQWEQQGAEGNGQSVSGRTDESTTCCMDEASPQHSSVRSHKSADVPLCGVAFPGRDLAIRSWPDPSWQAQDLALLRRELMQPLRRAVYLLSGADEDLMAAAVSVTLEAGALIEAAALAHQELTLFKTQMRHVLLQRLRSKSIDCQKASAEAFLAWHAALSRDIIPKYSVLCSRITYLKDCTELVVDYLHMAKLEGTQEHKGPLKAVGLALSELDTAAGVLSCTQYLWRILERTHLCLARSAEEAEYFRLCRSVPESRLAERAVRSRYLAFCRSLETLAWSYSGDRK